MTFFDQFRVGYKFGPNGFFYKVFPKDQDKFADEELKSWWSAKASCAQKGGRLATLDTEILNEFVLRELNDQGIDALSTGPLTRPLAPLTHSLALHCSLRSRAPLRSFIRSLVHSLPWETE